MMLFIGIAFMDDDLDGMYEIVRWILSHYNVSKSACSVYASAYPYGQRNLAIFSSPSSQKFFMRHIKETESVHGLVMAGHIFAASKSFSHALLCFARAWKLQPDDAQINLYLGLTYLHRATQRNTDNRHSNITHAFTFLFRYKKSRAVYAARLSITDRTRQLMLEQEALFNVARAFHTIGLLHFATTFYEDCLRYCDGHDQPLLAECGLQRECAYNLHLICVQSASPEQAKRVLQEHCTV